MWRYNNFECDLDFTDADFMERFENAYFNMVNQQKKVPKTGTSSEISRAWCQTFFEFVESVFGSGTKEKMFDNRVSVRLCVEVSEQLYSEYIRQKHEMNEIKNKYIVRDRQRRNKSNYRGKRS